MGVNPMQKMKRNSILIGLIIGLVIGLILCVLVYMFLNEPDKVKTSGNGTVSVCVLNKAIKSGAKITQADITTKLVDSSTVPTDATTQVIDGISKINLTAGTILSNSMITTDDIKTTKDLREQEYNMITLPKELIANDYIDIRLQLPNGGDYIVISKKRVEKADATTIKLKMNEEEILTMSNAIIEYYIMAGSKLYAVKYTDPGMQEAAIPTYTPNAEVTTLINANKNITSQIVDEQGRFSSSLKSIRNNIINKEVDNYNDTKIQNIEDNIQKEIQALKQSRQSYFGELNSTN